MIPNIEINRDLGRHSLPYKPNNRFILNKVVGASMFGDPPDSIEYYLDGKKRYFYPRKNGDTDGYMTYLGRVLESEIKDIESPIMDEQVIRLNTGEEITVTGNTVAPNVIKLRKIQ